MPTTPLCWFCSQTHKKTRPDCSNLGCSRFHGIWRNYRRRSDWEHVGMARHLVWLCCYVTALPLYQLKFLTTIFPHQGPFSPSIGERKLHACDVSWWRHTTSFCLGQFFLKPRESYRELSATENIWFPKKNTLKSIWTFGFFFMDSVNYCPFTSVKFCWYIS